MSGKATGLLPPPRVIAAIPSIFFADYCSPYQEIHFRVSGLPCMSLVQGNGMEKFTSVNSRLVKKQRFYVSCCGTIATSSTANAMRLTFDLLGNLAFYTDDDSV